jgi:hypothetical protein
MKKIAFVACVAVVACGFDAFAGDVWKDCAALYIGADDKNSSGNYEDGELFDICHFTESRRGGDRLNDTLNNISILTEDVACATLGRTLPNQKVLYFNGSATVTNNPALTDPGDISGVGNAIQLPVLITNEEFTALVRFKPDDVHPWRGTYQNFLNLGLNNSARRGFMLGLSSNAENNKLRWCYGNNNYGEVAAINLTNAIYVARSDTWHELAFVVSKPTPSNVTCRIGLFQPGVAKSNTSRDAKAAWTEVKIKQTTDTSLQGNSGYMASPLPHNGNLVLGGERDGSEKTKFRGRVHMCAFWNRALSDGEVWAAFGTPNPALFQVGSAGSDGSNMFAGGTDGDVTVSPQPENWHTVPSKLVQGKTLTISFNVQTWQTNLTQILQFTPSAGSGRIDVSINGVFVKRGLPVSAGQTSFVDVPGKLLASPGANTCMIVRTDNGSADLVPGGIELSGSWQIGKHDRDINELQSAGASIEDFFLTDGNWWHMRRVVLNNYSSRIHFEVHKAFANYRSRLIWATSRSSINGEHMLIGELNGTEFYRREYDGSDENKVITVEFPEGSLTSGMNEIYWRDGKTGGGYISFDFIRFELMPPRGVIIVIR